MKIAANYFREKAALCRQLAEDIIDQDDPVVSQLLSLADEFIANAQALETRLAQEAAHASGLDDALNIH